MKHVTFAEKSLLLGDAAADALLEYARVLADSGGADSVTLSAISPDGNLVEAGFLLNANAILMIESTNSQIDPPDNDEAVRDIRSRIEAVTRPVIPQPLEADWQEADYDIEESL